jgi:5-methylcytosine-specific restriction endonuclease McrA
VSLREIREAVTGRAGNRCERCGGVGVPRKDGFSALEVHHLNGRGEHPDNLMLLCRQCHPRGTGPRKQAAEAALIELAALRPAI